MGKGLGNMVDVVIPQNRSQQACFELIVPYAVERYPGENGNFQTVSGQPAPLLLNRVYEFVQLSAVKFCVYVFSLRKNITQENSFHVPKNRCKVLLCCQTSTD